jgi:hypothetical protein
MNTNRYKSVLRSDLEVPGEVDQRFEDTLVSLGARQPQTATRRKLPLLRPAKRIVLIAAVIAIMAAMAVASSPEFRDSIWQEGRFGENEQGNVVLTGFGYLPLRDELRDYIFELNGGKSVPFVGMIDGVIANDPFIDHELVFPSLKESADFIGVNLAYSPLISEPRLLNDLTHYDFSEAVLWELLSGQPGVKLILTPEGNFGHMSATIRISANSYLGDEEAIVSLTAIFRVIADYDLLEASNPMFRDQRFREITWPVNSEHTIYTSPENGVTAMIRCTPINDELSNKTAWFTVNEVMYTVGVASHSEARALEILYEVIDSLEWMY